ncbi:biotin--[acetyl-CoA-carboxylase] ligase, partial [Nocardia farcinica]|uniref:biotin--[acetyl-CoA-carboxylase] ligase n=1 Tax=Nocardia farcinica TaxID=37329 RepID=UPI003CC7DE79
MQSPSSDASRRPPLDVTRLRRGVESPELSLFSRVEVVEATGSTNADLIARASDPGAAGTVLLAETQQAGRGRHARSWTSPPRAQIAMSMLVRPRGRAPAVLGWLPLLTGVAVVDALRAAAGVPAELKWPNDVLIGGRKVAGILAEVAASGGTPAVVVGVGVNVSLSAAELPVPHAISLELAGAAQVDRTAVVLAILAEFSRRFDARGPARGGPPPPRARRRGGPRGLGGPPRPPPPPPPPAAAPPPGGAPASTWRSAHAAGWSS